MNSSHSISKMIEEHYARGDLGAAILSALVAAGKNPENLKPEDLAAVDEFHIRGREATRELASLLQLDQTKRVLDVGSGIGGASRYLALKYRCRVTGLDLTEEYCRVATMLAERLGLGGGVKYQHGDALHMPFDGASFDVVWTQHTAMNIPDKRKLYAEVHRVLRPDGLLAIYDILAGPAGPPHFPVPWATNLSTSFLITPDELRRLMEEAGFEVVSSRDTTDAAREWFKTMLRKLQEEGPSPLGYHLLLGPDFQLMTKNQVRNLEENRIVPIETVGRSLS